MALSFERFQQNFKGHPVPEALKELLLFQNSVNDWYSGSFELDIMSYNIFNTYIVAIDILKQFLSFGHDGNGSDYALWLYKEEMLPENAPIIYVNSEGEGSTVLANTLQEFLLILAYDEEPIFGEYSETEEQIIHTPANHEFRTWLGKMYNVNLTASPIDIVQQARLQHPALQQWIDTLVPASRKEK